MQAKDETPRTVIIPSPSARRETVMVARAVFFLLYGAAFLLSAEQRHAQAFLLGAEPAPSSPFERRFADLDSEEQRIYRALGEGITEAEGRRSQAGAWPTIEQLAAEGIPPFSPDPIDRSRTTWAMIHRGTFTNYLGTPDPASGRPSWIVMITEPDPGTPVDPSAIVDEVHHRLRDGTMIHVVIGLGPALGPLTEPIGVLPFERGYRQILTAPQRSP
ncbi:MAG: hypothetical protein U0359_25940 [Byssovorax sp.]